MNERKESIEEKSVRRCFGCGRLESKYTKMEKHHPLGREFEDFVVDLCKDCHDDVTDCQQKDLPIKYRQKPRGPELAFFMLNSLRTLCEKCASNLKRVIDEGEFK